SVIVWLHRLMVNLSNRNTLNCLFMIIVPHYDPGRYDSYSGTKTIFLKSSIAPSSFLLPDLKVRLFKPDLSRIVPIISVRNVNQEPVLPMVPFTLFFSPSRRKVFPDRASSTVHSRKALYLPG